MTDRTVPAAHIEAVRQFNRFHTRLIGALDDRLLHSDFTLPQARVLYEIASARAPVAASDLARDLGMDPGYLSRLIKGFSKTGLVERKTAPDNARRQLLTLTEAGREAYGRLKAASVADVGDLLKSLSETEQAQLVGAMARIRHILGEGNDSAIILRQPQPGDLGWIVHRQALLYHREYDWDETYEALATEIIGQFARTHDPQTERCWVADRDGEVVGSIFLVRENDTTARLRLLYVDPSARGAGLGRQLVETCIRFAREAGYTRMVLWTNSVLASARRIYEAAGFSLDREHIHQSFGQTLTGQDWSRDL